jgi:hypothetical protein
LTEKVVHYCLITEINQKMINCTTLYMIPEEGGDTPSCVQLTVLKSDILRIQTNPSL